MAWRTTRTEGRERPPPRRGVRWPVARPRRATLAALRGTALSDNRDLIGGVLGAALVPVASIGLGVPFWVSIPCAVALFFGVRALLRPRALFEDLDPEQHEGVSLGLARAVLGDADKALGRLRKQAAAIRDGDMRKRFQHLHYVADTVVREVEEKPAKLPHVRRLLTYYLPAAVRLAEGFRAVERKLGPSLDRRQAVLATVQRMDRVFADFSDRLVTPDIDNLDLELKLLDQELEGELRR